MADEITIADLIAAADAQFANTDYQPADVVAWLAEVLIED